MLPSKLMPEVKKKSFLFYIPALHLRIRSFRFSL